MGFKSSVAIAQTTRFKRKVLSSAITPPATPFNNTSFLIQLQQLREQYYYCPSGLKNSPFNQYGSMENMIACCSSFATLASPQKGLQSSQTSNLFHKECSRNTDSSTTAQGQKSSDPDGRSIFDYGTVRKFHFCSADASSVTGLKIETDPEMREGDGVLTNRHRQHFMDDNFDTHSRHSGSGTSLQKRRFALQSTNSID